MIPDPREIARSISVIPAFVSFVFAALVTVVVLVLPSIVSWFEDRA